MDKTDNEELPYLFRNRKKKKRANSRKPHVLHYFTFESFSPKKLANVYQIVSFLKFTLKKTRRRRRTGRTWAAKTSSKSVLLLGLARPTVSDMISFGSEVARLGQVDRGCFLDLFHGPFLFHGEIEPFFIVFLLSFLSRGKISKCNLKVHSKQVQSSRGDSKLSIRSNSRSFFNFLDECTRVLNKPN